MAKVLVVDDDARVRRTLCRCLLRAGHEIVEAENGEDALAAMTAASPDVVVTDIFMPQRDGVETIEALGREHPGVPIVVISGSFPAAPAACSALAEKVGAHWALSKPIEPMELLDVVETLTGRA